MASFEVTYADGTVKVEEQSDCHTAEQFINCRFGSADTSKISVELVKPAKVKEPVIEEKPATKKPK
jgi:hypothetical protein